MTRLASRFGATHLIRRDRPLTREELFRTVPSVFSENKHASRSERYTYIPTITLLDNLQREGFRPFFACQARVRDEGKREHTKHMLRLRREGQITGHQVPEIICSTAMTAPVRIRCCRDCSAPSARTALSAVSHSGRFGCRTREMWSAK
jgi:hypothetical protein